jgi:hypothetical protein
LVDATGGGERLMNALTAWQINHAARCDDGCERLWGRRVDKGFWRLGAVSVFLAGGIALDLYSHDETAGLHLGLGFAQVYLPLPFLTRFMQEDFEWGPPAYGFAWMWYAHGEPIQLHWGYRYKIIEMPWEPYCTSYQYLSAAGEWREAEAAPEPMWNIVRPYHYLRSDGSVQESTATVYRRKRESRWHWFGMGRISQFLRRIQPFGVRVRDSIEVDFSPSMEDCRGCGYQMKPGESPIDTLSRMQRERRFD